MGAEGFRGLVEYCLLAFRGEMGPCIPFRIPAACRFVSDLRLGVVCGTTFLGGRGQVTIVFGKPGELLFQVLFP